MSLYLASGQVAASESTDTHRGNHRRWQRHMISPLLWPTWLCVCLCVCLTVCVCVSRVSHWTKVQKRLLTNGGLLTVQITTDFSWLFFFVFHWTQMFDFGKNPTPGSVELQKLCRTFPVQFYSPKTWTFSTGQDQSFSHLVLILVSGK